MSWIKTHWKVLAAVLALVLWAAWYSRPVDIYTAAPRAKEPDYIILDLRELGGNGRDYPPKTLSPGDPEWEAALEAIEALRFRRPPWNPILQFIPKNSFTGRATHEGDLEILFRLGRRREGLVRVQFFIDEWSYSNPLPFSFANRGLTLWVENPKETGSALAEAFRPLLEGN